MPVMNELVALVELPDTAVGVSANIVRAGQAIVSGLAAGLLGSVARDEAGKEVNRAVQEYLNPPPEAPTVGGGPDATPAAPPQMPPMWLADP